MEASSGDEVAALSEDMYIGEKSYNNSTWNPGEGWKTKIFVAAYNDFINPKRLIGKPFYLKDRTDLTKKYRYEYIFPVEMDITEDRRFASFAYVSTQGDYGFFRIKKKDKGVSKVNVDFSTSQKLDFSTPQKPDLSTPQKPILSTSQKFDISTPQKPDFSTPQKLDYYSSNKGGSKKNRKKGFRKSFKKRM
jgi:hypothetical protein